MAVYKVISGNKGWIEDVIVDQKYRGMGIGMKLIEKLLSISNEQKLSEVLLFTEEHRTSAISLYEKLGFIKKKSSIYRLAKEWKTTMTIIIKNKTLICLLFQISLLSLSYKNS